jgi:hypothetical protein
MKTQPFLTLHFSTALRTELIRSEFKHPCTTQSLVCVRGKTRGAYRSAGTFQWSTGVRGVCCLALQTVLAKLGSETIQDSFICGEKDSLAASLDYAISKQPDWIGEMFGITRSGKPMAKRIFARTNAERKRPGPVAIAFNEHFVTAESIQIVLNGKHVRDLDTLRAILREVAQPKTLGNKPKQRKEIQPERAEVRYLRCV